MVGEAAPVKGGQVEVPVSLSATGSVSSIQFSLAWNPAVFEWVGVAGSALPGFGESNVNALAAGEGHVSVSWDDPSGIGVSMTGSTSDVVRLVLRVRSAKPSASLLRIVSDPTPVEVVSSDVVTPVSIGSGWIQIGHGSMDASSSLPGLRGAPSKLHVPTWLGGRSIVETTEDLGTGVWTELESIEGDGEIHTLPVASGRNQSFYRMRWEP